MRLGEGVIKDSGKGMTVFQLTICNGSGERFSAFLCLPVVDTGGCSFNLYWETHNMCS